MSQPEKLSLHPQTSQQIDLFLAKPHHFLLLAGPLGLGKLTVGLMISSKLLNLSDDQSISKQPFFHHVSRPEDKKEISIETIRDLIAELGLKTTGQGSIRRIVLIEDAQHLSEEAQNALLKTLEEPPADTVFISTIDSLSNLLPTIASRAHIIDVQPISLDVALKHFRNEHDKVRIEQAWQLSGGRVGLLHALLEQGQEHELKQAIDQAKIFLKQNKYDRLLDQNKLSENREKLQVFLDALQMVIQAFQKVSIQGQRKINQIRLINSLKLTGQLKMSLDANVGSRLVYLTLCLNLDL